MRACQNATRGNCRANAPKTAQLRALRCGWAAACAFPRIAGRDDIAAFVDRTGGYLKKYTEEVDGVTLTGPQIVQRAAQEFSVNPRSFFIRPTNFAGRPMRSVR